MEPVSADLQCARTEMQPVHSKSTAQYVYQHRLLKYTGQRLGLLWLLPAVVGFGPNRLAWQLAIKIYNIVARRPFAVSVKKPERDCLSISFDFSLSFRRANRERETGNSRLSIFNCCGRRTLFRVVVDTTQAALYIYNYNII